MKPDGVIAFHVTNRYLDLVPVVEGIAHELDLHALWISDDGELPLANSSSWVLLAKDPVRLTDPQARGSGDQHQRPPRLARVDRRLQQPGAGAEVTRARIVAMQRDGLAPHADPAPYRALVRPPKARHVDVIDQRALPHALVRIKIADARSRGAGHPPDVDPRRAADRRGRRVRPRARARPRRVRRGARQGARRARRHAARPRSTCAGRSTACARRWRRSRRPRAPTPRGLEADAIAAEDVTINHAIGEHGIALLRGIAQRRPGPVRVMTHCNAGALATCGWGTATAPLFLAHLEGLPLQVWVSETRPRMQGASLTAWELDQRGIPHTLVADSASGLLMQRGDVDVVIVGADRVARNGDVCNKIGTYDKALAARDNNVPFYVALPSPTIDWSLPSGEAIPIEARDADEVLTRRRPRRLRPDGARGHRARTTPRRSTTRST